jgi:hypothetical protein
VPLCKSRWTARATPGPAQVACRRGPLSESRLRRWAREPESGPDAEPSRAQTRGLIQVTHWQTKMPDAEEKIKDPMI